MVGSSNGVDLADAIYVSPGGHDDNAGTRDFPKLTIGAGAVAGELEDKDVRIAAGTYAESVTTQVTLQGGYEAASWDRDPSTHLTTLSYPTGVALQVQPAAEHSDVEVSGMTIEGGTSGTDGAFAIEAQSGGPGISLLDLQVTTPSNGIAVSTADASLQDVAVSGDASSLRVSGATVSVIRGDFAVHWGTLAVDDSDLARVWTDEDGDSASCDVSIHDSRLTGVSLGDSDFLSCTVDMRDNVISGDTP